MECKCKYFLRNEEGKLYCTQCGKIAVPKEKVEDNLKQRIKELEAENADLKERVPNSSKRPEIEDKMVEAHEDKAPLYVSDKDKVRKIWPPKSKRLTGKAGKRR